VLDLLRGDACQNRISFLLILVLAHLHSPKWRCNSYIPPFIAKAPEMTKKTRVFGSGKKNFRFVAGVEHITTTTGTAWYYVFPKKPFARDHILTINFFKLSGDMH
jgi:hypothetical protein